MTENMVHLTSRVPRDLLDKLEEMAKQRRMQTGVSISRADLVREALETLTGSGSAVDLGQPLTGAGFGPLAMEALTDLERLADEYGIEDAQDMAMSLGTTAEQDPRTARLREFVSKLHGALQSV